MDKSLEYRINRVLNRIEKRTGMATEYDIRNWDWGGMPMSKTLYDRHLKEPSADSRWLNALNGMIEIEKMIEEVPLVEAITSPSEYVRKYREFREKMKA